MSLFCACAPLLMSIYANSWAMMFPCSMLLCWTCFLAWSFRKQTILDSWRPSNISAATSTCNQLSTSWWRCIWILANALQLAMAPLVATSLLMPHFWPQALLVYVPSICAFASLWFCLSALPTPLTTSTDFLGMIVDVAISVSLWRHQGVHNPSTREPSVFHLVPMLFPLLQWETISVTVPSRTDNETAMCVSYLLLFGMPDWCLWWPFLLASGDSIIWNDHCAAWPHGGGTPILWKDMFPESFGWCSDISAWKGPLRDIVQQNPHSQYKPQISHHGPTIWWKW